MNWRQPNFAHGMVENSRLKLGFSMEKFCRETIREIKMAKDEEDLIHVISASISRLRKERNSFNETGYIMNMIVSLLALNTSDLPTGSVDNINLATAIFRQLQSQSREHIF